MVRGIFKIDIGETVETEEYCSVVDYSMDKITGSDQGIVKIIQVILEEEISEGIFNQIRIIEIKTTEVDIEEIIETIIMKEAEIG